MVDTAVKSEALAILDSLPREKQVELLVVLRAFATSKVKVKALNGAPGGEWAKLSGTLSAASADEIEKAIEEGFERVDPNAW